MWVRVPPPELLLGRMASACRCVDTAGLGRPVRVATVDIPTAHSFSLWERRGTMATLLVFHEVDDVDHWVASPKREELFGPLGMTARTFRDPEGSNRVGLIVEVPDISVWQETLQTEAAAEAMKFDGVRPDTIVGLVEA